jgi:hypothetical protein
MAGWQRQTMPRYAFVVVVELVWREFCVHEIVRPAFEGK